jgi:hypothetical protein
MPSTKLMHVGVGAIAYRRAAGETTVQRQVRTPSKHSASEILIGKTNV